MCLYEGANLFSLEYALLIHVLVSDVSKLSSRARWLSVSADCDNHVRNSLDNNTSTRTFYSITFCVFISAWTLNSRCMFSRDIGHPHLLRRGLGQIADDVSFTTSQPPCALRRIELSLSSPVHHALGRLPRPPPTTRFPVSDTRPVSITNITPNSH